MQHILKSLVQFFRIYQCRFQHGNIHSGIIFEGKKSGIYVLNINIGILQRLVDQLVERADKNGCVVRDDYIGGHRRIVLDFTKPFGPQQPVQYPFRHCFLGFFLCFRLFLLHQQLLLCAHLSQNLHTGFPAQEKIIILIFIINRQKGFHINFPVHRPEKPPEGGGDII